MTARPAIWRSPSTPIPPTPAPTSSPATSISVRSSFPAGASTSATPLMRWATSSMSSRRNATPGCGRITKDLLANDRLSPRLSDEVHRQRGEAAEEGGGEQGRDAGDDRAGTASLEGLARRRLLPFDLDQARGGTAGHSHYYRRQRAERRIERDRDRQNQAERRRHRHRRSELDALHLPARDRGDGEQIGRILGRDGEPGEAADELAREQHAREGERRQQG